jgi:GNAT superfamily N-acetyltransferase
LQKDQVPNPNEKLIATTMSVLVRQGSIDEIVAISQAVPEFFDPHGPAEYTRRLQAAPHLILVAEIEGSAAGFKVGYALDTALFYSWMGAVLPEYRQHGVAKALADAQEQWAIEHGYQRIRFKTRNRLKAMLHFALGNGFNIIGVEPREELEEYRILLEKAL